MLQIEFCVVLILGFTVFESHSLQCWTCSSDIDPTCRDRFNATDFRYGGFQQAGYSGFNQPPYDPYNQPRPYDRDHTTNRNENYRNNPEIYRDYSNNMNNNNNKDPYYNGNNRDQIYRGTNINRDEHRQPSSLDDRNNRDSSSSSSSSYPDGRNFDDFNRNQRYNRTSSSSGIYYDNNNNRNFNNETNNNNNNNNRFNFTEHRGLFRNDSNLTDAGGYFNRQDRYNNNNDNFRDPNNRDRDVNVNSERNPEYRGDYNKNRDFTNRNSPTYSSSSGDSSNVNNRDNFDYRNRDLNRDNPAYDRDHHARDPLNNNRDYNNRDYNRDNNNNRDYNQNNRDPNYYRDSNRDPYFNRDPNNPNNRDYPQSSRDYNRDYQGRNYDPNYPARDPQQQQYPRSQAQLSAAGPKLQVCNEDDAQTRHVRTVCIKKVQRYNEYQVTYIRRCEVIPYDKEIGTCHDAVARGISLDFCEYCDYDGCNSATSQKFNIFLISFLTLTLFWRYFS